MKAKQVNYSKLDLRNREHTRVKYALAAVEDVGITDGELGTWITGGRSSNRRKQLVATLTMAVAKARYAGVGAVMGVSATTIKKWRSLVAGSLQDDEALSAAYRSKKNAVQKRYLAIVSAEEENERQRRFQRMGQKAPPLRTPEQIMRDAEANRAGRPARVFSKSDCL